MNADAGSNAQLDTTFSTSDPTRVDWLEEYPPPRSLRLDREALRIYEHAYALGLAVEKTGTPPITFSTVIAALFAGLDETSIWFTRQAKASGPLEEFVFEEKKTNRAAVEKLRPIPGRPKEIKLSEDKHLLTASARSLLGIAEGWAQKVRGSEIGVRHLVASYVLNPPAAHRSQMQKWQFKETLWRQVFFAWAAERYTAEQWTDASNRPGPAQAIPEIDQVEVKGEALAFPGDTNALAVLTRAAELHARRSDDWLGVQTLWHALIEKNSDFAGLLAPIGAAAKKAEQQYARAVNDYFPTVKPVKDVVAFDALDISPRVLNALETARELAVATRGKAMDEAGVSVLHLAGALVSRRVDCDPELISFGFDPDDLRSKLIEHASTLGESGDAWRDAVGEQETKDAGRPLELNSDEPEAVIRGDAKWADDPLQIRRDVEMFASLLATKSLEPPLSIGLFGPWGSGKTTFLKRLRLAVERRANEAQNTVNVGNPTPYVQNVVHVDFNAWHYSEGALTSSLVDTILRRLGDYITNKQPEAGKEWERRKVEKLESTRRKVEAAEAVVATAATGVTNAEEALVKKQEEATLATVSLRRAAEQVWTATLNAFKDSSEIKKSGVLNALGETVTSAEELRTRLEALRNRPARMLRDLGWLGTIGFAALVLGVPLLAAWACKTLLATNQTTQTISAAAAAFSAIGLWVRGASAAVARVDKAVDQVAQNYASQVENNEGLKTAQRVLALAQAEFSTATANLQAAREELARARADAASATLPAQMLQLITSRLDSQSYSRELTTTSLARADLEAISVLLRDQRNEPAKPPTSSAVAQAVADTVEKAVLKRVERVILYIDDLDRCKPQDVVRVLQLVHMLLAFELFAVVVAVDARWVEESLRHSYKWLSVDGASPLADSDGAVTSGNANGDAQPEAAITSQITPQDYLEKIFQIAFWLTPMTAYQAAQYLKSLVRVQARRSGPVVETTVAPAGVAANPQAVAPIEIQAIELDYMRYLASYVGSSPRRVKRLVNAYRLIKANLTDPQLDTFLRRFSRDESGRPLAGPYQLVIGLLAIGTGVPASAAQIFREIEASNSKATPDEVVQRFRNASHPDWSMAAQVIEVVLRSQRVKDIRELREWTAYVGRFLLNSPLYEARRTVKSSSS